MLTKLFSLLIIFSFFSVSSYADDVQPTPPLEEKIDWNSLQEFAASISHAYETLGSDQLAGIIYDSGVQRENLERFRAEVEEKLKGEKFQIAVPFSTDQLKMANKRLWNAGLDFIELVRDPKGLRLYAEIPEKDVPKVQQLLMVRSLIGPTVALLTGLTVGIMLVKTGHVVPTTNSANTSAVGFYSLLSPFIAAGLGGAFSQYLSDKLLYRDRYTFTKLRSEYRPFSFWGKFLFRDFLFPVGFVSLLSYFVSQGPQTVLSYTTNGYGAAVVRSAEAAGLAVLTLGLGEVALEKLKQSRAISQLNALKLEATWSPLVISGMMIFLTSSSLELGAGVMGTVLIASVPLWYKILGGDRVYDWYTKKVLAGDEADLSWPARVCGKALAQLSRFNILRK